MALLARVEGQRVLSTSRAAWEGFQVGSTETAVIDMAKTPMGSLAATGAMVAAVAKRTSAGGAVVEIYRDDPQDHPAVIDQDRYAVLENLADRSDFLNLVDAASTQYDANLHSFCSDNVFLFKQAPGDDHWLEELPDDVCAVMRST